MACQCEVLAGRTADLSPTCIGHLWVFQDLPPEEIEALATAALRKNYQKGEAIFRQGDPAHEVMTTYFDRQSRRGPKGARWWLFSVRDSEGGSATE
jgi:hypothetical protein